MEKKLKKIIFCVGLCLFLLSSTNFSTVTASPKDNDRFNGTVFFMRHALAPGNGDPKKFLIGDCRTQRNLDETGRRQAFEIGKKLKKSGLIFSAVYTSRWCRCIETADILDLGYAIPFDGLNSFYQGHFDRDVVLEKLRTKLKTISKVDNPTLMVTHFVTIQAITGMSVRSGSIVVYDLKTGTGSELALSSL